MSSLDAILAASDSDDDTTIGDIRLEDILNDEDDDSQDDEPETNVESNPSNPITTLTPTATPSTTAPTTPNEPLPTNGTDSDSDSNSLTLEDILANDDDDDDDDELSETEEPPNQNRPPPPVQPTNPNPPPRQEHGTPSANQPGNPFSPPSLQTHSTSTTNTASPLAFAAATPPMTATQNTQNTTSTNTTTNNNNTTTAATTTTNNKPPTHRRSSLSSTSSRLLLRAETKMKTSLHSTEGTEQHVLSPLAVKRRYLQRKQTSGGGTGDAARGSVGVVATNKLDKISTQLAKNAQYKQHGPGLPTTISVHSKFIAIGTSHGVILVFDHFQEVRVVLGSKDGKQGTYGAVTALDMSPTQGNPKKCSNKRLLLWVVVGVVVGVVVVGGVCDVCGVACGDLCC